MEKLQFNSNPTHTLGVELELGIVDGESYQLASGCRACGEGSTASGSL